MLWMLVLTTLWAWGEQVNATKVEVFDSPHKCEMAKKALYQGGKSESNESKYHFYDCYPIPVKERP